MFSYTSVRKVSKIFIFLLNTDIYMYCFFYLLWFGFTIHMYYCDYDDKWSTENICKIWQQAEMKGLFQMPKWNVILQWRNCNFHLVGVFVSIGLFLFTSIFVEVMTIWQLRLWNGRLKEVTVIFYLLFSVLSIASVIVLHIGLYNGRTIWQSNFEDMLPSFILLVLIFH